MTKKICVSFFAAVLLATPVFAQEREKEVTTSISEVTLYLTGATITRTAQVDIDAGFTTLVISGLSSQLDSRSIQVGLGTDVSILSVTDKSLTTIDEKKLPILRFLTDSIEMVKYEMELERNTYFALDQELSLILANKSIGGANSGVEVPELEEALILYRKELPEIKKKLLLSTMRLKKLQTNLDTLNNRYYEFKRNNERYVQQVSLTVSSDNRVTAPLTISYYVGNAGWTPKYDIRALKVDEPVTLAYKAEMRQNTGENWDGVRVILSTNNPMYTPALPSLYTNFIELNEYYNNSRAENTYRLQDQMKKEKNQFEPAFADDAYKNNLINSDINIEIPFKVRLKSDNQPMVTEVNKHQLPVVYKFFTVPKAELATFMKANITGWEEVNLIYGEANLYLEGTYLGKTNINPETIEDTLSVYMGKDRRIVVKRNKVKEKSGKNFFGNKITQTVEWEIEVRNTKKEAVTVEIQDQIPVSKDESLAVEKDNLGGAELNEETGLLTWYRTLQPGETIKLRFGFTLKYPKGSSYSQERLRQLRKDNYM
ncbi:MAG TPA: DUF4139 domain-containing protein [Bacteroidia bacterium]|nr:DUF4139 domain-containing protein [Bacteroidia bacterium]